MPVKVFRIQARNAGCALDSDAPFEAMAVLKDSQIPAGGRVAHICANFANVGLFRISSNRPFNLR